MVEQRFVPGAPPPAPLSKSQKKKRKAKVKPADDESPSVSIPDAVSAALVETSPEVSDIQDGTIAPELVVQHEVEAPPLPEEEILLKPSPIVDLIHKRLKATTKKISRISIYASTDPEKLNDDQKRTLKTLPTLEAVQKELGEVKKAVEVHEAELTHELASKRHEVLKAEQTRIADAVSVAEASLISKLSKVLAFLRLQSLLQAGDAQLLALDLDEVEVSSIFATTQLLLGEEGDSKKAVVEGLLSGTGDIHGIAFSRLLEITDLYLNPPRSPTPVPEQQPNEQVEAEEPSSSNETEPDVSVAGIPEAVPVPGSFHFMQASELETPSFDDNIEWVEKADAAGATDQVSPPELPVTINGHSHETDVPAEEEASANEPRSWADDEGGLPSLADVQAEFATSGSATPVGPTPEKPAEPVVPKVNGHDGVPPQEEDDGFTQARGGRARGRGHSRGSERGGFRGLRGGERGAFRGNGPRGGRGGERSGDRGGYRGRPSNGEWRGADGEFRGRGGRGRGRGDRGGYQEGRPPATPA